MRWGGYIDTANTERVLGPSVDWSREWQVRRHGRLITDFALGRFPSLAGRLHDVRPGSLIIAHNVRGPRTRRFIEAIAAINELPRLVNIAGATITIDAMCRRKRLAPSRPSRASSPSLEEDSWHVASTGLETQPEA